MTDAPHKVVQLIRNFAMVGAGNYGAMAVSLGINALLTRRLGVDGFGHLALLLTASQFLALLGSNWTYTALIRFAAQEFSRSGTTSRAFWARIWVMLPWFVLALAGMYVWRQPLANYLLVPAWALILVVAHFFAAFMLLTIGGIFQARNEMRRFGAVLFLDKALMALLLLAAGTSVGTSPVAVMAMYTLSSFTVLIWAVARMGPNAIGRVHFDGGVYRQVLAFSMPLLLSGWVALFGTNWFDIVIIRKYQPIGDVGLYSLATVLAGVVQQVTIIFSTLLLPQLSVMVGNGEILKIKAFIDRFLPYWFLATSALFTVVPLVAAWAVPLIFGRAFAPAASVVAVLMLAACALALFNAFSPLLAAFGATWALTGITLASGATNVAMDFLLIPRYGIMGAAVATVLAYGVSALLVLAYVRRRLEQNVFRLAMMALPVVAVCLCFLLLTGQRFYLAGLATSGLSMAWLMHRFQLFRGPDAMFLKELPIRRTA